MDAEVPVDNLCPVKKYVAVVRHAPVDNLQHIHTR